MSTRTLLVPAATLLLAACASEMSISRQHYATPEDALDALADESDDPDYVRTLITQRVAYEEVAPDRRIARIGDEEWEVPYPLVRDGDGWAIDLEAGREELRSRQVGANELRAIDTLHELVDAQHDFRASRGSSGPPAFAARWSSDGTSRDGLHWTSADGEPESPVGACFCLVDSRKDADPSRSAPVEGYCYRILDRQGDSACGGACSYRDEAGRLSRGFAFLAWPADYGETGVMTFQVDGLGIVWEKDLGPSTDRDVRMIEAYDPDDSWEPAAD